MQQYTIIDLGGKSRRLKYDFNAIADLEAIAGAGIGTLMTQERMGFNTIRLLLWAGLKHENRNLTLQQVGDMMQDFMQTDGDLSKPMEAAMKALELAGIWGKADEGNAKTEAAN